MKRLLILTALAFAAITAPASAITNNEAIFLATIDSGEDFGYRVVAIDHLPYTTGNDKAINPSCFDATFTRIPDKGGCYRRYSASLVVVQLSRAYLHVGQRPQANYYMRVADAGAGCKTVTSFDGENTYFPTAGGHISFGFYRQHC